MSLIHRRAVGDTLSDFSVQLTKDGTPYNLTDMDVAFVMVDDDGNIIVAETQTGITISAPLTGYVDYDFPPVAVANPGTFHAYFRVYEDNGTEPDTFPANDDGIRVEIFAIAVDREPAAPSLDILTLANAPIRTRTAEGTVEERSVNELIKADQYATGKAAAAAGVPWGIRTARTRPGGMVT